MADFPVHPLDREHPGALLLIGPAPLNAAAPDPHALEGGTWAGRANPLSREHVQDPDTLLAYEVNGETLNLDHGYPLRLIGPNRPGVMQTKWLYRMVVR